MENNPLPPPSRKLWLLPLQAIVAFFVVADELARPLYGPLSRRFAALRLVALAQSGIERLPRFVILVLLAAPIAVAEPLKVYALVEIAEGRIARGIFWLISAYLASFLVIERIYEAGKPKLMTIVWFARLMGFIAWFKERALDWLRKTPVWGWRENLHRRALKLAAALKKALRSG